jgi:hypothetical protein
MDLKTLELKDLKALAYEQVKLLNQTQNNLQVLENEITLREKEANSKGDTEPVEGELSGDTK